MMEQCKKCIFYDEKYDLMNQPDTIIEGESSDKHVCIQYRSGIPQNIVENVTPCDFYINKLKATP